MVKKLKMSALLPKEGRCGVELPIKSSHTMPHGYYICRNVRAKVCIMVECGVCVMCVGMGVKMFLVLLISWGSGGGGGGLGGNSLRVALALCPVTSATREDRSCRDRSSSVSKPRPQT